MTTTPPGPGSTDEHRANALAHIRAVLQRRDDRKVER